VGQVASQTLENMAVIDAVATRPILRPLVGMDKDEIVAEAERVGTYPISIIPDEDCCQLFTPPNPSTRARLTTVERAEQAIDVDELVEAAASAAVAEDFRFPAAQTVIR
jgi:thiamine biosynthesis protein ThiI